MSAKPSAPAGGPDGVGARSPLETRPTANGERLAALLEQFDSDAGYRAYVERLEPQGAVYLGAIDFTESLYDDVKAKWGGGRYAARIMDARRKYAGRVPPFAIGGKPKDGDDESAPVVATASHTDAPRPETAALASTLERITTTLETMQRRLLEQPDPLDQLVKLSTVLKTAMPAVTSAAGGTPPSETLTLMRELIAFQRELADDRPAAPASSPMGALVETVKPLVGVLNRKLALDEARLRERADGRTHTINRVRAALTNGHGGNGDTGAHGAASVASSASEATLNMSDPLVSLLVQIPAPARRFLVSCAVDDDDPDDYVPTVLNRLTDEAFEAMREQLERPDFVDVLVQVEPGYAPYRGWFSRLVEGMRASLDVVVRDGAATEGVTGESAAAHANDASRSEQAASNASEFDA